MMSHTHTASRNWKQYTCLTSRPPQVTLSYLGRQLTLPLEARRAELEEKFGFQPSCPRWAGCRHGCWYGALDSKVSLP